MWRKFFAFLGVIFLSPFLAPTLYGQVGTAWVARYNGSASSSDAAGTLAVDDSGYIYVTGYSISTGSSYDYVTIKYKPNGDTSWVRKYDGPGNGSDNAFDLAVDDSGYVYVTGAVEDVSTFYDYATIKYAPNGNTVWAKRYFGPANNNDLASALAVDDFGNVYVTGSSLGLGDDYATVKYSPTGDTLWTRRYNGPNNAGDVAADLVLDDSGYVYVTGFSFGPTNNDFATIKYSPAGDTVWLRRFNTPISNSVDKAYALAVDRSSNVYVTGSGPGVGSGIDYLTVKYSPTGDTLWVRRYKGFSTATDEAFDIAVDDSGRVFVTGRSMGSTSNYDYATICYSSLGDTLWVRRYNGPGNSVDQGRQLALDSASNVYVTGPSYDSGSGFDYATLAYSPTGDTLWLRRYNGSVNSDDNATAMAVDKSGNIYVTGESQGSGTDYDYTTIKYSTCAAKPGDANASGTYSLSDVIAIVNYIFNKPGCSPQPLCWISSLLCRGDWNGSGTVSLSDVIAAVNYIFNKPGGPWNALPVGVCCLQ